MKKMIVKVQLSLFTSDNVPTMLAYTEGRRNMYEGPATTEIIETMGQEPKKFFWAMIPEKPNKKAFIEILEEAPWQEW